MNLRVKNQWVSYKMTAFDWVCAASEYNAEIDGLNTRFGKSMPMKTPRALMDKLGEIEAQILQRISADDYTCKYQITLFSMHLCTDSPILARTSKNTDFWSHHCHAVPLVSKTQNREKNGKPRMVCPSAD